MHENHLPGGPMLLTFTEAARALGVSLSTIKRLTAAGKLLVVELDTGRSMAPTKRIRRSDLAGYVATLARAS